jgi:hypothetical protein
MIPFKRDMAIALEVMVVLIASAGPLCAALLLYSLQLKLNAADFKAPGTMISMTAVCLAALVFRRVVEDLTPGFLESERLAAAGNHWFILSLTAESTATVLLVYWSVRAWWQLRKSRQRDSGDPTGIDPS